MQESLHEPLIISASRTKDMVRRSPDLLADILLGKTPCRWGPHGPSGHVNPARLHSVVLWTKDPHNLLWHQPLREALLRLRSEYAVLISLELTSTGLGGSFIEPGIPPWRAVYADLQKLLGEGWISPEAMVYRYDPFLSVRSPAGKVFTNAKMDLFAQICGEFLKLGLLRVTTSRADAVHYPRVAERFQKLGLEWLPIDDQAAGDFCHRMSSFCQSRGADFSVCCDPLFAGLTDNWGCIDARRLNRIKGDDLPALEILHNLIGKQRPACQCTYSRDIGYSTGSATCYSGGFGCLYCYAQGNALPPNPEQIQQEIEEFDQEPEKYLEAVGLPLI